MPLFGKHQRKPQVEPVETKFDQTWFAAWGDKIFANSGIDPNDGKNQRGLVLKLMRLMSYWGGTSMEANGAVDELGQYRAYLSTPDSTPWGAMSFIAGWDDRALPAIEGQLARTQTELTELARKDGNLYDNGWA
ncbi:MAG TPA: hypothetical protein VMU63_09660 [Acidimicrobiales bacterium]|nr:hypothetical protein [Acidimicrobiales bacterium]